MIFYLAKKEKKKLNDLVHFELDDAVNNNGMIVMKKCIRNNNIIIILNNIL